MLRFDPSGMLLSAALLALCASPSAQTRTGKLARPTRSLGTVSLDLATGTVTRGPVPKARSARTVSDFPNLDLSGFVGVDSGNCFCEWFDAGVKGKNNNASDLMSEIVFPYCSAKLDPSSGGPGGSVKLGFYEGYTVGGTGWGGPPNGTAVAVFTLTGLPANTASSSFFGGFRCFFMTVRFDPLVCFADGPIGYSWKFRDLGRVGTLAGTWPYLSCVQSCSGRGPDGLGMVDAIDEYCPPGQLRVPIYGWGTTPYGGYFSSMAMDIREARDSSATATGFTGDGINKDTLCAIPAEVGGLWGASVAIPGGGAGHGHGSGGPLTLIVRAETTNGPNFVSPVGSRLTEFLLDGALLARIAGSHDGATGSIPPQAIPRSAALLCVPWAAQAVVVGGGFADLSTAISGITGTESGLVPAYADDMEVDRGWTVGAPGDTATSGLWTRVDPNGTSAQPENDHSPSGVRAWVTGQGAPGGFVGLADVDGGVTTLTSQILDASGLTEPYLAYWRWFSNNKGTAPFDDVLVVELSNDGGASWVTLETVGPSGEETSGGWRKHSARIADFRPPTSSMRLRFRASDLGVLSIVEAALDDLELFDAACAP